VQRTVCWPAALQVQAKYLLTFPRNLLRPMTQSAFGANAYRERRNALAHARGLQGGPSDIDSVATVAAKCVITQASRSVHAAGAAIQSDTALLAELLVCGPPVG
jgi:hypothetical protein